MDSVNLIKALRYVVSNDLVLMGLLGESTALDVRNKRLFLKDSFYASKDGSQCFPAITLKVNDDSPIIRGADDNAIILELCIWNKYGNPYALTVNLNIKDRLKLLLEDNSEIINSVALTFAPPVILKIRDVAWASAASYDDKEQGSERVHKNICILKLIVGD